MKIWLIGAAVAIIGAGGLGVYVMEKPSDNGMSQVLASPDGGAEIPTPQYLFEHPDALKRAEQACNSAGGSASLLCSNVHKAESLRLADQYRQSTQPGGVGK